MVYIGVFVRNIILIFMSNVILINTDSYATMAPAVRHRLTKSDITPFPKRIPKKTGKKDNDFKPKSNKEKVIAANTNAMIPAADIALKAFLSARFCAAIWSHIADCDETYNYWEPLHYLVYGRGLQTWEYSPQFALRSYTYLVLHGVPAWFYDNLFHPNPMLNFYFIRCVLGLSCAVVELYFYKAVCREFGIQIGRLWLIFQLFSPGMFVASTALLPSSFSMYFTCAAMAAWWHQRYPLAIFFVAISSFLGWPFAALLGLPLCYDILFEQKKYKLFFFWAGISAATIFIPMVVIDSSYFGKLTIAPLNIILYNVFTSHGPNLYGTEPWTFYFINGFLNYNIVWISALLAPLLLFIGSFVVPAKSKATLYLPYYLSLAPLYLWLLVFIAQPHKEERFLYPIYPMIALCGAISIDVVQKMIYRVKTIIWPPQIRTHYLDHTMWLAAIAMILSTVLGLSRITALYLNYHAPLDLMMDLNTFYTQNTHPDNITYNVCTGKDWYRFPSSFFLPSSNFRLRFLKSEFNGILPAYYTESENGTAIVHNYFNDLNQENETMYFNYAKCHFLFDLDTGKSTELEPNYVSRTKEWVVLKAMQFLNTEKSHKFFRAFYLPFINEQYVEYTQVYLLRRKKMKMY